MSPEGAFLVLALFLPTFMVIKMIIDDCLGRKVKQVSFEYQMNSLKERAKAFQKEQEDRSKRFAQAASRYRTGPLPKTIQMIDHLEAKAASSEFPAEKKLYQQKAKELRHKHGL